jgi:GTPase SAR1 family protein
MVLVGNKTDLGEASRKVHRQEVTSLVKSWGNCIYLETSAKEKVNVAEAFTTLLRMIVEQKRRAAEKAGVRRVARSKKSFCSACTIQ